MKLAKYFSEALAIALAIFILLYILTCYVKFNPDESKLLEKSKLSLYLEEKRESDVYYIWLCVLLLFAAAVNILLTRLPAAGVFASAIPTCYALTLYANGSLTARPMSILLMCICFCAGTVVYAAAEERRRKKNVLAHAGMLCAVGGLAITSVCAYVQHLSASVSAEVAELAEARINISARLQCFPDLVRMIWGRYRIGEESTARSMLLDFERSLNMKGTRMYFFKNIDPEQFKNYLRLALVFFALAVLWFAFRGKLRLLAAGISVLPLVISFFYLINDGLSAMPLVILPFALLCAACGFASYDQEGREPISEIEKRQTLENLAEPADVDPLDTDGRDEYGKLSTAKEKEREEIEYDL